MSRTQVIAVFDIGKTNKKLFLFDESYQVVLERTARFGETTDEDGEPCEDLFALAEWVKTSFEEVAANENFDLRAVNFSAYGASFVHVSESGEPVFPLYNYLKVYPPALLKQFFEVHGAEEDLSRSTASPVLGSLNSGLQLYRLRHERNLQSIPGCSLHLPQYLSFLITGKFYSELTSLGCHTMMWDFERSNYHKWVAEEGLLTRLPAILPSDEVNTVSLRGNQILAGVGLHDSSSALIPYLSIFKEPFVLISTGTWCITLNPFNDLPLTADELREGCLSYLGYHGRPVKASRLFAGHEHECAVRDLSVRFNVPLNFYESVEVDLSLVAKLKDSPDGYLEAGSYEEAYHLLMVDIVRRQERSSRLVLQGQAIRRLFVDGGFARNPLYMELLAQAFPEMEVYSSSVPQASAIGAALAIHRLWNRREVPHGLISLVRIPTRASQ